MAVKLIKWPQNIPTSSITRHSEIYPKLGFWFENKPSGNPGRKFHAQLLKRAQRSIFLPNFPESAMAQIAMPKRGKYARQFYPWHKISCLCTKL
jgi:hypothetical protein